MRGEKGLLTWQAMGVFLVLALSAMGVAKSAWATWVAVESSFSWSDSQSDSQKDAPYSPFKFELMEKTRRNQARAPEPTTIMLFGGGLAGMVVSFVRRTYAFAKRVMDIVISVTALILLSPVIAVTALAIQWVSPGPILFTQTRVGKGGRLFKIYKFRSMKVDAEKETGPVWASESDPRLIPFLGRFLRKSHIDEIPQFFNVLKGEMSVIGPRPERPEFVAQLKEKIVDYEKRLQVKPGITGLAQVWHRYDETLADVRKKIKYDLLYIRKICLWTDLRILLRTVRVVLTGEGAR